METLPVHTGTTTECEGVVSHLSVGDLPPDLSAAADAVPSDVSIATVAAVVALTPAAPDSFASPPGACPPGGMDEQPRSPAVAADVAAASLLFDHVVGAGDDAPAAPVGAELAPQAVRDSAISPDGVEVGDVDVDDEMGAGDVEGDIMMQSYEPTEQEKTEMRKSVRSISGWLHLIARDWCLSPSNCVILSGVDTAFEEYKPFLRGRLSFQLFCKSGLDSDLWARLGVQDEFDRMYVVAQVEKFAEVYQHANPFAAAAAAAAAATAAGMSPPFPVLPFGALPTFDSQLASVSFDANASQPADPNATAAAAAAALAAGSPLGSGVATPLLYPFPLAYTGGLSPASASASLRKPAPPHRPNVAGAVRRLSPPAEDRALATEERRRQRARERDATALRKQQERIVREVERDAKRRRRAEEREQREREQQRDKDAALQRAADVVVSNRIPIEITRGIPAPPAPQNTSLGAAAPLRVSQAPGNMPLATPSAADEANDVNRMPWAKKSFRSSIVVSTAADLDQIVKTANALWEKYKLIAKEHNQKVNWATVAKDLGINVKVREKYARMHARAIQRGFDFERNGHLKIKDHRNIFHEPLNPDRNKPCAGLLPFSLGQATADGGAYADPAVAPSAYADPSLVNYVPSPCPAAPIEVPSRPAMVGRAFDPMTESDPMTDSNVAAAVAAVAAMEGVYQEVKMDDALGPAPTDGVVGGSGMGADPGAALYQEVKMDAVQMAAAAGVPPHQILREGGVVQI